MGQFSWLDCKDGSQILDDVYADVYLLIPKEFGGGHIHETCYEGYGEFGGKDVYDLVVDWNKDMIPWIIASAEKGKWKCSISNDDKVVMECFCHGNPIPESISGWMAEKRHVGIIMGCYDEDNARLWYPIKITHDPNAVYEKCDPSLGDPNQGWKYDNEEEW